MRSLAEVIKAATGISCHSQEVRPGYIFVAIRGRSQDGNNFAYQAALQGASAIISDTAEASSCLGTPVIRVPDARTACAWLAAEYYRHPSKELSLAGVTGTNGKTTIAAMLQQMYLEAGLRAGMIGTVKVDLGGYSLPSKLTTPDAVSLQYYLRQMRDRSVSHAAMEVSAQGLELKRVEHVNFTCGILTNICPDHLDFHGDFASYIKAKQLFPALLSGAPLIVNAADPHCLAIARKYDGPVITTGVNTAADISANVLSSNCHGSVFQLAINRKSSELTNCCSFPCIRLPVPGLHNVENALQAAIAALVQGISPYAICRALAAFNCVERRFKIYNYSGCTVIDDTALNPGSINAVFQAIRQFRFNRLIVVNAIRGCRGAAINAANAQALTHWQSILPFTLIITASNDHTNFTDKVTSQEKAAFLAELDRARAKYLYMDTLAEAISAAQATSRPGDLLLLIGAQGMDQGCAILTAGQQPLIDYQTALPH